MVHEVGDARDPARRDRKGLDRIRGRLGWRRNGDGPGVRDVVEEPYGDAALHGCEERREDECPCVRLEANVVEREVERGARGREEAGDVTRDVRGALPTVGEGAQLDRSRRRAATSPGGSVPRAAPPCERALRPDTPRDPRPSRSFPRHGCSGTSSRADSTPKLQREHGAEARDLHLPEARKRADPLA